MTTFWTIFAGLQQSDCVGDGDDGFFLSFLFYDVFSGAELFAG